MRVAELSHYLFDAGFARVDILHGYSSDSPRGLVLPDTFGVDRETSLRWLGRGTRRTHEITLVTEPTWQYRASVWKRPLLWHRWGLAAPGSCIRLTRWFLMRCPCIRDDRRQRFACGWGILRSPTTRTQQGWPGPSSPNQPSNAGNDGP